MRGRITGSVRRHGRSVQYRALVPISGRLISSSPHAQLRTEQFKKYFATTVPSVQVGATVPWAHQVQRAPGVRCFTAYGCSRQSR